ncbi:MAG TPA: DUF6236 family protein [Pseudonocardiaceae bacterium]
MFYYPKINAPQSVIHQALLYWDHLVTVAPDGPLEGFLDHRMRQVHDAGLYTRLPAENWPGRRPEDLERALRLVAYLLGRVPADDLIPDAEPDSYLYTAKLSRGIRAELARRGVTRQVAGDSLRIQVSAATQLCLISAAARDIAARHRHLGGEQEALYAYTDSPAAHRFAHTPFAIDYQPPGEPDDQAPGREWSYARRLHGFSFPGPRTMPCWDVEIGSLLPVPGYDVDVRDLIAFRERYNDERHRLMTAIDLLVHGIQRNFDHPQDVLRVVQRELEAALADLEHAGRAARITWVRRSVTVSIALAASWAAQKLLPEAGWMLGVIAGAAINVATNSTRPSHHEVGSGFDISTTDISYLYRVHSALR